MGTASPKRTGGDGDAAGTASGWAHLGPTERMPGYDTMPLRVSHGSALYACAL